MIETGKEVRALTNIELIRKAEEFTESLQLESAVSLYEEGVQRFPNDTVVLDGYSDLLIQLGEIEKAKLVFITFLYDKRVVFGKIYLTESSQERTQISQLC